MTLPTLFLSLLPLAGVAGAPPASAAPTPAADLLAIRARRAETVANGTLEHAVILVEDGKIVRIGQDLPIARGIPVLDLPEGWTVMPGLVDVQSRVGMDGEGFRDSKPHILASDELYPTAEEYGEVLETGVTTLGQVPAGDGIPGQAVAVRPKGETPEEMILRDHAYLKIVLEANSRSKERISEGFEEVDEYLEKEKKNREKWEEDQEKKKKKKKDDDEDDDEKDDEEEKGSDEYVPLEPDPEVRAFMQLRDKTLRALISIRGGADYEHMLDAIGDEDFEYDLRVPLTRYSDIFHVMDKIAEQGLRVVMEPEITLHPETMRQRNLPAEFARAGIEIVLVPRADRPSAFEEWLRHLGEVVAAGLDRDVALRAVTQSAADLLQVGDQVGSLEEGKAANLIFLNGDPFEPGTRLEAVMLDGEFVHGEVEL